MKDDFDHYLGMDKSLSFSISSSSSNLIQLKPMPLKKIFSPISLLGMFGLAFFFSYIEK
jgi:hypothetical protein